MARIYLLEADFFFKTIKIAVNLLYLFTQAPEHVLTKDKKRAVRLVIAETCILKEELATRTLTNLQHQLYWEQHKKSIIGFRQDL